MKTGKVWGTTHDMIRTPMFEAHHLHIYACHQCSMHRHARKANAFVVIEGRLYIDVKIGNHTDTTMLEPGEIATVQPGIWHRFRTDEDGAVAYEFYYPEPLSTDIERRDTGGAIRKRKSP